jgi:DNA-binding GntR family transcriptional regulator
MNDNHIAESHKQLRGWVADRLRADIHEGRIQPGEWLRQERLAQEYGVSQMPVREAFKQLVAEGILEQFPYRGVQVVQLSAADVEDLYATRSFLEGRAARAAALSITEEELQELKSIQAQITAYPDPEQANLYRPLNRRFHQVIANASHRPYLTRVLGQMWEVFPAMLWNILPLTAEASLPERVAPDWEEHSLIIQALENHDPELSEKLVKQHIEKAAEELLAAMQRPA